MTDLPACSGPTGEIAGLLHVPDELDRVQGHLEEEFRECKIGPVLNADSPGALRDVIKRANAEVLEKITAAISVTAVIGYATAVGHSTGDLTDDSATGAGKEDAL
jgi:hypothetical protein